MIRLRSSVGVAAGRSWHLNLGVSQRLAGSTPRMVSASRGLWFPALTDRANFCRTYGAGSAHFVGVAQPFSRDELARFGRGRAEGPTNLHVRASNGSSCDVDGKGDVRLWGRTV